MEIPPNLAGLRLVFSTNRSAQTYNPIDRQNFGADKKASKELVKLLSDLIAKHATSRTQRPQPNLLQIREHEDLLLQFLIKRSKARVIKKATNLYKQVTKGLDTTFEMLVLPPNPNHPVVTNWVDSLAKLRRLAKPFTDKNNELVPKQIRVLSDYCALLLSRPIFDMVMRARIRTLEKETPDLFDEDLRLEFGIPLDWNSEELISVAKLGRRLDRFASFKSGASAICADMFPAFVKWAEEKKKRPASPFFGPPAAIGALPGFVNTGICFVLPPDIHPSRF